MTETMNDRPVASREQILNQIAGPDPRCAIADHFALFCEPERLARFMMRHELFKKVLDVHGSVVECGVKTGDGLMQWHHLSRLLEPLARRRIVYGFDTFAGFPSVHEKDGPDHNVGDEKSEALQLLVQSIEMNRLNNAVMCHDQTSMFAPTRLILREPWHQVVPVVGDFMDTGAKFLERFPHVLVALLYLDFDLYEPTKRAIELFLPRMPKGAVIAFDEADHADWPGETLAILETVGVRNLELKRFAYVPTASYAVLS